MILGAVDDKGDVVRGQYKPEEFGKITVWQMRNIFGYRGKPETINAQEEFWKVSRLKGQSEFEIWRRYADEVRPLLEMKR